MSFFSGMMVDCIVFLTNFTDVYHTKYANHVKLRKGKRNNNNTDQQNFMTKMLLGNRHMFLGYFFKLISNLETIFLYQV